MQILGLALLALVVWYGFGERADHAVSAFDLHAFIVVLGGSFAAVLVSSSATTTARTFLCLRELLPGAGVLSSGTQELEEERAQLVELWLDGRRAQAIQLAEGSRFPAIARLVDLVLSRASVETTRSGFTELRHQTLTRWQPAIANWELLARLAPSFGMVGTITGMIQLFKTLDEDTNMGASISLALLATLYGIAFGAGVAGPIGHYLRGLLDERMGALERCEQTVQDLISRSSRAAAGGA